MALAHGISAKSAKYRWRNDGSGRVMAAISNERKYQSCGGWPINWRNESSSSKISLAIAGVAWL